MTWISKTITTFGLVLVAHACYSAHEHSALQSLRATSSAGHTTGGAGGATAAPAPVPGLPLDISLETVLGLFVAVLGLVAGTPRLRPIEWRVWAGMVERDGGGAAADRDYVGNPFRALEARPGFVDVRAQRREFAAWVRAGGKG